jgi:hypothetical protein
MKKLTMLLVVCLVAVNLLPFDTATNLYLNPVSFLGLVLVAWFSLGTCKLAKSIINKIKLN